MTCSMTAATGTVAFAEDAATEESADDAAATDDAEATDDTAADAAEATDDASADADASSDDQKAADEVGALIDKIYVQERTDTTDDDCKAAKEAWDKLTDAQKELVTGEMQILTTSAVTQEMLPKMIHATRMKSVKTSF